MGSEKQNSSFDIFQIYCPYFLVISNAERLSYAVFLKMFIAQCRMQCANPEQLSPRDQPNHNYTLLIYSHMALP
jgi:hypothetical protein